MQVNQCGHNESKTPTKKRHNQMSARSRALDQLSSTTCYCCCSGFLSYPIRFAVAMAAVEVVVSAQELKVELQ